MKKQIQPCYSTEHNYCKYCGTPPTEIPIPIYNEFTGEQLTKKYCLNPKCVVGCLNTTGHKLGFYRTLISLFNNNRKCPHCGNIVHGALWRKY